jgi:hypothetical protein
MTATTTVSSAGINVGADKADNADNAAFVDNGGTVEIIDVDGGKADHNHGDDDDGNDDQIRSLRWNGSVSVFELGKGWRDKKSLSITHPPRKPSLSRYQQQPPTVSSSSSSSALLAFHWRQIK